MSANVGTFVVKSVESFQLIEEFSSCKYCGQDTASDLNVFTGAPLVLPVIYNFSHGNTSPGNRRIASTVNLSVEGLSKPIPYELVGTTHYTGGFHYNARIHGEFIGERASVLFYDGMRSSRLVDTKEKRIDEEQQNNTMGFYIRVDRIVPSQEEWKDVARFENIDRRLFVKNPLKIDERSKGQLVRIVPPGMEIPVATAIVYQAEHDTVPLSTVLSLLPKEYDWKDVPFPSLSMNLEKHKVGRVAVSGLWPKRNMFILTRI